MNKNKKEGVKEKTKFITITKNNVKWECISENTYRLEVIGGWIVNYLWEEKNRINESGDQKIISGSMVFVPDFNHLWTVEGTDGDYIYNVKFNYSFPEDTK